jgi:hypothetical protein
MHLDAVIHSRLQTKAHYGFFLENNQKVIDRDPYTAFANSWETAALARS